MAREIIADKKNQLILPRAKFFAPEQGKVGATLGIGLNRFEEAPLRFVHGP
jgi:hypothetical protein